MGELYLDQESMLKKSISSCLLFLNVLRHSATYFWVRENAATILAAVAIALM